jgi:hypothetical protein
MPHDVGADDHTAILAIRLSEAIQFAAVDGPANGFMAMGRIWSKDSFSGPACGGWASRVIDQVIYLAPFQNVRRI